MALQRRLLECLIVLIVLTVVKLLHRVEADYKLREFLGLKHSESTTLVESDSASSNDSQWPLLNESIIHGGLPPNNSEAAQVNHPVTLVIARMKDEDVSWIDRELPEVDVVSYVANDVSSTLHPPKNKGYEAMIYLSFIIENYYRLSDITIFMHAHRWTHHNNDLLGHDASQMVRRLNPAHVIRQGYVNMRCHWSPGCPEWLHPHPTEENMGKQEQAVLAESWEELFPTDPLPPSLSQPCCAQFALSRARIRSIPLSQFVFYRDWILRTPLSDYISGRIWEYSWHYLFTGQSTLCPAEHLCYCDAFGICFGGPDEYQSYRDLQLLKKNSQDDIKRLTSGESGGGGGADVESRLAALNQEIQGLDKELEARKQMALERGNDPRSRAEECGRVWRDGDGF